MCNLSLSCSFRQRILVILNQIFFQTRQVLISDEKALTYIKEGMNTNKVFKQYILVL